MFWANGTEIRLKSSLEIILLIENSLWNFRCYSWITKREEETSSSDFDEELPTILATDYLTLFFQLMIWSFVDSL